MPPKSEAPPILSSPKPCDEEVPEPKEPTVPKKLIPKKVGSGEQGLGSVEGLRLKGLSG